MSLLRKKFDFSREAIWGQLSAEIGASYVPGHIEDGFWKREKVQASHGPWIVTLDTDTVLAGEATQTYTRLRAPYVNPDGFRFAIFRRSFSLDIYKRFGMQDVEIGDAEFDRDFIIQGTDAAKLRQLFAAPKIRELIALQPQIHFSVRDSEGYWGPQFPPDTDELYFTVFGVIQDVERLKQLFELFAETLDQLCSIGSAYEAAPDLKL